MASTKDILKAQRFNRSRLITAFQSGMPDGRELTPMRPWGPIIGGIIITVVLFGVAWVSKLFAPALPSGWEDGSLVVDEESGARYVTIESTLHPVRNASSAHLLFPSGLKVVTTKEETLSDIDLGEPVGIEAAPDKIPTAESIAHPYLVSCLTEGTHWTGVNIGQAEAARQQAAHVVSGDMNYLVVGNYRHPLVATEEGVPTEAPAPAEGILNELGLPLTDPIEAPAKWLNLIEEGEPLTALTLPNFGKPAGALPGSNRTVEVGTLLKVTDGGSPGAIYIVKDRGQVERMTPLMIQLYALGEGTRYSEPVEISAHDLSRMPFSKTKLRPTWPEEITGFVEQDSTCLLLDEEVSEAPILAVGEDAATHAKIAPITVKSQTGAIVEVPSSEKYSTFYLLDEAGTIFHLPNSEQALSAFTLTEADTLRTPRPWLDLFPAGPELSAEAAWATVPKSTEED